MARAWAQRCPTKQPPALEHQGSDKFLTRVYRDFGNETVLPYGDKQVVSYVRQAPTGTAQKQYRTPDNTIKIYEEEQGTQPQDEEALHTK